MKGCAFDLVVTSRQVVWLFLEQFRFEFVQVFQVSIRSKGNCYENSTIETFFKTIKAELIWRRSWPTRRAAELAIFEYINGSYNPRGKHSALG